MSEILKEKMPRLVQVENGVQTHSWTIPYDRPFVVGRSHAADATVGGNCTKASGRHLELTYGWGGLSARNNSSHAAAFVNGQRLGFGDRVLLKSHDVILLGAERGCEGGCEFVVEDVDDLLPSLLRARYPELTTRLGAGEYAAAAQMFAGSSVETDRVGFMLYGVCRKLAGDEVPLQSAVQALADIDMGTCDDFEAMLLAKCRAMRVESQNDPLLECKPGISCDNTTILSTRLASEDELVLYGARPYDDKKFAAEIRRIRKEGSRRVVKRWLRIVIGVIVLVSCCVGAWVAGQSF